jgi:hypothetical protein
MYQHKSLQRLKKEGGVLYVLLPSTQDRQEKLIKNVKTSLGLDVTLVCKSFKSYT